MAKQGRQGRESGLRKRAEELLSTRGSGGAFIASDGAGALIHELQTHQIELELQNEELRRSQLRLTEARARYAELYDFAPVGYLTVGGEGRIRKANLTLGEMLGRDRRELLERPFTDLIAEEDQDVYYLFRRSLLASGKRKRCELGLRRGGGDVLEVQLESVVVPDMDGEGGRFRMAVTDISERKTAEREKERLEERLRHSAKMEAVGQLAGGIAHDFNNVLGIIIGNVELAQDDVPERDPVFRHLDEIKKAGMRAADIVRQLLNFGRKSPRKPVPVDMVALVEEGLGMLRSSIPSSIEMVRSIRSPDAVILGDRTQMDQVLINLCINSAHAVERTGGRIEITVDTATLDDACPGLWSALSPGDYAVLTVADSGPGIDPAILDRIFDPYFTTKDVGKGVGMGLAVVHGIVEKHGGAVRVENRPGGGAAFCLAFPRIAGVPAPPPPAREEISGGGERILFVDDERAVVKVAHRSLTRLGYSVKTVSDPHGALALFRAAPGDFDLVITDLTMPGMTGIALFEKLKAVRRDIPVVVCSGHGHMIDGKKALKVGIAAVLPKPLERKEMARAIRRVLDRKAPK